MKNKCLCTLCLLQRILLILEVLMHCIRLLKVKEVVHLLTIYLGFNHVNRYRISRQHDSHVAPCR